MSAYEALAASYDRLTNDVDYEAVVTYAQKLWTGAGLRPRLIADLACGTGSVSAILAEQGYDVVGVDLSQEMLTMAWEKCAHLPKPPLFIHQPLEGLQLYHGVDVAFCGLDSLDYITEPENCRKAIRRIYKALNPGGMFIFDVNTPEKLRAMDGQVFLDEDEDVYCV